MCQATKQSIRQVYSLLYDHFGPLNWWPADTPFEVAVGAILTQNTAWTNVEKAIVNLKRVDALSTERIAELSITQLEELIRPSGFFRQKAARLQSFARHMLERWNTDLAACCAGPLDEARNRLLALAGIGPETADSILLYAANRPSFVVDAYTRRIFARIGLLTGTEPYQEIRRIFMDALPEDVELYNEYHAQIVMLAKTCCFKKSPECTSCPLRGVCSFAAARPKHTCPKMTHKQPKRVSS